MAERRQNFGHAVEDGKVRYFSPSSLTKADPEQYSGCLRRWFYYYVLHFKEPFTGAQKKGVEAHDQIEHYLRTGEKTLGSIVMAGAHFIPAPGPTNEVEFSMVETRREGEIDVITRAPLTAAGVPVVGYGDLLIRNAETWIDEEGEVRPNRPNTVEAIDWKTTSRLSNAKPGDALARTIQMPGYGEWAARTNGTPVDWVRLSHVTFQSTGRPQAIKRSTLVSREDIARRWEYAEAVARTAIDVAHETDASKVPANTNSCKAYGGCPHAERCEAKRQKTLSGLFGATQAKEMKMSVLSMLNLPGAAPAPTAPPVEVTPIATPTATGVQLSMMDQIAALKKSEAEAIAARAAAPAPAVPPVAQAPLLPGFAAAVETVLAANMGFPGLNATVAAAYAQATGITVAPGAGLPGHGMLGQLSLIDPAQILQLAQEVGAAPAPAPVAPVVSGLLPADAPASNPAIASKPIDVVQVTQSAPVTVAAANCEISATIVPVAETPAAPPAKKSPGRPRKTVAAPSAPTTTAEGEDASADLEIYVNALPTGGAQDLAPYIAALCQVACKAANTEDVRVAPSKDSPLAYGGWKGVIAALARETPPRAGRYSLIITGEISEAVAEGLAEFVVARGVRS